MINQRTPYVWPQISTLLTEGRRRDFMTDEEKKLQRKLVRLLRDDGEGHHHAAYAKRLEKYDVNIVPLGQEPFTAAISFDEGIIYINRGFLRDPTTFKQLNVIMRHELCHNLLMHQFRMIKKLDKIVPELNLSTSGTMHELLNILEDFEISNKKYSAADKETVRNTWINGKLISGLVTEDHRTAWLGLSLEKMYDEILAEIAKYNDTGKVDYNSDGRPGNLNIAAAKIHSYKNDINKPADVDSIAELKQAILQPALKYDKDAKLPDNYLTIMDSLQKGIVDDEVNGYSQKDIDDLIAGVAKAKAIGAHDIVSPTTGEVFVTVYTPEEKALAIECLKIIGGHTKYQYDFQRWYTEIKRKLGTGNSPYTPEQLEELRDILK